MFILKGRDQIPDYQDMKQSTEIEFLYGEGGSVPYFYWKLALKIFCQFFFNPKDMKY